MWKTWILYLVPVLSKCPQHALLDRLLWNMWNRYLVRHFSHDANHKEPASYESFRLQVYPRILECNGLIYVF